MEVINETKHLILLFLNPLGGVHGDQKLFTEQSITVSGASVHCNHLNKCIDCTCTLNYLLNTSESEGHSHGSVVKTTF